MLHNYCLMNTVDPSVPLSLLFRLTVDKKLTFTSE